MADPSNRTSTAPSDPVFPSEPLCSPPSQNRCPRPLSGRLPLGMNAASGSGAECRLVELRGLKVASFTVDGAELMCLPQVFQLFLKHLVGGLHTVYTKLKRLRITPVVCSVEQVRVLRGLGAIRPGVNRCKLISRAGFDALLRDCSCASSRPGRPPKRTFTVANMSDASRLLPHGLLSPALLSQTGLPAALRMRIMMRFHGDQQPERSGAESENEDAGGSEASWEKEQHFLSPGASVVAPPAGSVCLSVLQQHSSLLANSLTALPFMLMPRPLLPVTLPSVAMAMNQMSQLSSLADMTVGSQTDDKKEIPTGSPSPSNEDFLIPEPTSQSCFRESSSSPPSLQHTLELANESMALTQPPSSNQTTLAPLLLADGPSPMETLLTNIQGLLKVAAESAGCRSERRRTEKKELRAELDKERDARRGLQRQLSWELKTQESMQRRLKKEKKAKRKLQVQLDGESRRRGQVERSLRHSDRTDRNAENSVSHHPLFLPVGGGATPDASRCFSQLQQ